SDLAHGAGHLTDGRRLRLEEEPGSRPSRVVEVHQAQGVLAHRPVGRLQALERRQRRQPPLEELGHEFGLVVHLVAIEMASDPIRAVFEREEKGLVDASHLDQYVQVVRHLTNHPSVADAP
ncbi:MAG: hypothetical protein AVDCRST_MAG48-467, partial [uncultured Friedmanniella sp.]